MSKNNITVECAQLLHKLRRQIPLVHAITNYVTVNDVANAVLAIGASPIMADDIGEAADIAAVSSALVLNIGTLSQRTVQSMLAAGTRANQAGVPVVLDPVGAGASPLRDQATMHLLSTLRLSVLRGNLSEISFTVGLQVFTRGVDASARDAINNSTQVAKDAAQRHHCVSAVTGPVDIISDGRRVVKIHNGHPLLSRVTGTGCMTSGLVAAFAAVSEGDFFTAAAAGVACMGIAGELAYTVAGRAGAGSFHIALIDALSQLDAELFQERANLCEETE